MSNQKNFSVRKVDLSDEVLILNWSNDSLVRRWSFNSALISKNKHNVWFRNKFHDKNVLMLIFEVSKMPAGLVRFEKKRDKIILNYLIAPSFRGEGLAVPMLTISLNRAYRDWGNMVVFAYTIPGNIASKKSLEKVGFSYHSQKENKLAFIFNID